MQAVERRVRRLNGVGTVSEDDDEVATVSYSLMLTDHVSVERAHGMVMETVVNSDITGTLVVIAGHMPDGVLTLALARQQRLRFLVTLLRP